ncbi:MAG: hypothetical protein JNM63_08560 [Spirochaetia bacterium]|nr:hypothetical protein [Spirochaetia bacterium]
MNSKLLALIVLAGPGFLFASLLFFPADGRKKRDNPADQRATNYQGFASTSETQTLTVLNAGAVANGDTFTVQLSNEGWKPFKYKLSTNTSFADVASWSDMPANRLLSFTIAPLPGDQIIYGKFLMSGNKEVNANATVNYLGRSVFVDINTGSDANSGVSVSKPLKTLVAGYALAVSGNYSNILVASGTYNRANGGLNAAGDGLIVTRSGLRFIGGFAAGFSNYTTHSMLDSQRLPDCRTLQFLNVNDVTFTGFHVRGGTNQDPNYPHGGGILIQGVNRGWFTNIVVTSNFSTNGGGGIGVVDSSSLRISGLISTNFTSLAFGKGGGIFITNSSYITNVVLMEKNSAAYGYQFVASGPGSGYNYLSGIVRDPLSGGFIDCSVKIIDHGGPMTIESCVITNLINHGIGLAFNSPYNNQPDLVIRSNIIGVQNVVTRFCIWESVSLAVNNVSNHWVHNNVFMTNALASFYQNYASMNLPFNGIGPGAMNTPLHFNHDAIMGGNTFYP